MPTAPYPSWIAILRPLGIFLAVWGRLPLVVIMCPCLEICKSSSPVSRVDHSIPGVTMLLPCRAMKPRVITPLQYISVLRRLMVPRLLVSTSCKEDTLSERRRGKRLKRSRKSYDVVATQHPIHGLMLNTNLAVSISLVGTVSPSRGRPPERLNRTIIIWWLKNCWNKIKLILKFEFPATLQLQPLTLAIVWIHVRHVSSVLIWTNWLVLTRPLSIQQSLHLPERYNIWQWNVFPWLTENIVDTNICIIQ